MNAVSADNGKPWSIAPDERTAALEIVLLKRTYVLPWSQFLYAEGGEDEIRLVFVAHDVVVRGSGLSVLLADLAAQRVAAMREPSRTRAFLRSLVGGSSERSSFKGSMRMGSADSDGSSRLRRF